MKKINNQTYLLENPVYIHETASIVGPKEKDGPMANYFDTLLEDEFWGEKTWEKAESKIIKETVNMAITKSEIPASDIDYCFAGDTIEFAKPVIGTKEPAPANFPILLNIFNAVKNAVAKIKLIDTIV